MFQEEKICSCSWTFGQLWHRLSRMKPFFPGILRGIVYIYQQNEKCAGITGFVQQYIIYFIFNTLKNIANFKKKSANFKNDFQI